MDRGLGVCALALSCGGGGSDDDDSEPADAEDVERADVEPADAGASGPVDAEELAYSFCLAQFDDRYSEVVEAELVDGVPIDRPAMKADFEACVRAGYSGAATDLASAHCEGFYRTTYDQAGCNRLFAASGDFDPLELLATRIEDVMQNGIDGQLPA